MKKMQLSIVIPLYNEEATILEMLDGLLSVEFPVNCEYLVVNDGSTDRSGDLVKKYKKFDKIKYIEHKKNSGKGAAVKTGIQNSSGDYVVIQDADLEYDPHDILKLLKKIEDKKDLVVYGSRLTKPPVLTGKKKTPLLTHYFGNRFLSVITSLLYGTWLSDMETCYKLFPRNAMDRFKLNARGFELEPEITAKLLKNRYKIVEVPISTKPRGYDEGKKINTWKDGWKALYSLIKYRFID